MALAQIGDAARTRWEMILQCSLGASLIFARGMVDEAREALTRGLSLARTFRDFDYQQRAMHKLWLFSFRLAAFDDALAIARDYDAVVRLHDPQSRAVAAGLVGAPQVYRGEHIEASTRLRRAIDHYPIACRSRDAIRLGNDLIASAFGQLSVSLLSQGLLDTASRAALQAVEEARGRRQPIMLCAALAFAAGFVFLSLGEFDTAERHSEELIVLGQKHALRPFHAAGLCIRGGLATRRTDPNGGVDLLRRGLADLQAASYLLL